jgi:hypothetical protein
MKINKTIGALAIALGLSAAAQAQTTVFITGSTAFRSQIYAALGDLGLTLSAASSTTGQGNNAEYYSGTLTQGATIAHAPSGYGSQFTIQSASGSYDVYCDFTGSAEGCATVALPINANNPSPVFVDASGNPLAYDGSSTLIAMSDVLQTTTQYAPGVVNAAGTCGTLVDVKSFDVNGSGTGGMAVVPFTFATTPAAATKIQNITSIIAADQFFAGREDLSFYTGNNSDASTKVYAVGRTNDSGTRYTMQLLTGLDDTKNLKQYALAAAGANVANIPGIGANAMVQGATNNTWVSIGNGGYPSGGSIAEALNWAPTSGNYAYAVGYVAWSDCTAHLGNGQPIALNGINPSQAALGSWTSSANWNTNALVNGTWTYWSYEHMYLPQGTSLTGTSGLFATDLVDAMLAELHNFGSSPVTAMWESDLNVYRSADGGDISHN